MKRLKIFSNIIAVVLIVSYLYGASDVLQKARDKISKGEYTEAVQMLEKVVAKHTDLYEAYFMLAKAYYKLEKYNKAFVNLEKCIRVKKDFIPAHLLEVNILEKKGELEAAESKLKEAITIKSNSAILVAKLGDIYTQQEKTEDAIKAYIKSFEIDKKFTDSVFKAVQLYMEKKQYKLALELLDKIEDEIEEEKDKRIYEQLERDCKYNILIQEAESLFSANKIKDSLDKYEEAKDIKATDINLDVKIAECYYLLKEIDDAEDILDEVLKKHKNHSGALRIKSAIFYTRKKYKEAEKYIIKAIENETDEKNRAEEEYLSGNIYEKIGDLEKAKKSYRNSIKEDKSNWKPYFKLAILQAEDKEYDKSIKNLKKSQQLCKDEKGKKKIEKLIKQVRCYYYIEIGNRMFDKRAYKQAIEYYDKALESDENNLVAKVNKGNAFIALRNPRTALDIFKKIIEKKEFIPAYAGMARAYKMMKIPSKAEEIYNKMQKIESQNWKVYYDTGIFYEQNKKYKKAIERYNKAKELAKSPETLAKINDRLVRVFYILGRDNLYKKKFKTARKYLQEALKLKKHYTKAKKLLERVKEYEIQYKINQMIKKANKYVEKNLIDKAIKIFHDILKIREVKEARYSLANCYYLKDRNKEASDVIEKYIRRYQNDIEGILLYAQVKIELKEYSKAEQVLVSQLKKGIRRNDKIYYLLGSVQELQGRLKEAEKNYLKAIKINKNNFDAHISLGNLYYKQKSYSKAEAEYKYVLKTDPSNDVALYNLGYIYYKKNKLDIALKMFKKAEKLITGYAPLYFNIGRILYYKKDYHKALEYVKKTIKLKGKDNILYKWGMANIYVRLYQKSKKPVTRKKYRKIARKLLEECIYNTKNMNISAMARRKILEVQPERKYLYTVQQKLDKKFLPQIIGNVIIYYVPDRNKFVKCYKETYEKIWDIKVEGKPAIQYQAGVKYFYAGMDTGEVLVIDMRTGKIRYRIDEDASELLPFEDGVLILSKDTSRLYYYKEDKSIWDVKLSVKGGEKNRISADENIFFLNNEKLICIDKINGSIKWEYKGSKIRNAKTYKNIVCVELKDKNRYYAVGLSADNGKQLWKVKLQNEIKEGPYFSLNSIAFVLKNNSVIVSDTSGRIKWQKRLKATITSCTVKEEQLLLAYAGNQLRCYNIQTGKLLWKYRLNERQIASNKFYTIYYQQ